MSTLKVVQMIDATHECLARQVIAGGLEAQLATPVARVIISTFCACIKTLTRPRLILLLVQALLKTEYLLASAFNHVDMASKVILINKPTGVKELL